MPPRPTAGLLWWTLALTISGACAEAQEQPRDPFAMACELESQGRAAEAFKAFLAIPGGEFAAVKLARPKAKEFLSLLDGMPQTPPQPRTILVRGDLLLALGDKAGALTCYRQVLGMIAKNKNQEWTKGFMPQNYYPVEPPGGSAKECPPVQSLPFALGCGSHRDNWLIRRLLALEAYDDAGGEFERIWAIHRERAGKGQFDALGLEFAIDYAFFLKKRNQLDNALAVLQEPLLRIDMDRNPGLGVPAGVWVGFGSGPLGLSRKEFIRLAFGQFKASGKEDALVTALTRQIEGGRNAARRVLARIRLHQGKVDEAVALELDYIQSAGFEPLTKVFRRGSVYEDLRRPPEAAAEYEKALALPYAPLALPDPDEEAVDAKMHAAAIRVLPAPGSREARIAFQTDLLGRLRRLYAAMGIVDKVMDLSLRELDIDETTLGNPDLFEQTAASFKAAGHADQFLAWARRRVGQVESPQAKANLCWALKDTAGTVKAVVEVARSQPADAADSLLERWKERFASLDKPSRQMLLEALVKARPTDAFTRLELLDVQGEADPKATIQTMESLLESDVFAWLASAGMRDSHNRTPFRNSYDLAYRLMRLYEKEGQIDRLLALGLRVAQGKKPFSYPDFMQYSGRESNDVPEMGEACLAVAIAHATDAKAQEALAETLAPSPWEGAKAQVARVRAGGLRPAADAKPFGWSGTPEGVILIASNECVLSLCRDDKHLYVGQPWGVAVYDFDGKPVTRVPLQTAALHMVTVKGALWVGTPIGLYRIDPATWDVSCLSCDQNVPAAERQEGIRIFGLAAQGDLLWIAAGRNILTYNTKTNAMKAYSAEDMGLKEYVDAGTFLFDGRYVWIADVRYDPEADRWQAPPAPDERHSVHVIGLVGDTLWGDVWVNGALGVRPCIIDRQTLKVTPVLIEERQGESVQKINGPFFYVGQYHNRPVFRASQSPLLVYDAPSGKMKPTKDWEEARALLKDLQTDIPDGLRWGVVVSLPGGALEAVDDSTHSHTVAGRPFGARKWSLVKLPDGTRAFGGVHSRSPRYQYPSEDSPFANMVYETPDGSGGLHFLSPQGEIRRVSSRLRTDAILGDTVFAAVPDEAGKRLWLCTNFGVSLLDEQFRVVANFTRHDGLLGNRVSAAVSMGGKMFFAGRWDDERGGLMVFDPATSVFTSLFDSDGLATNSLESLAAKGEGIELTYGVQYLRSGPSGGYRLYAPTTYTPSTGIFSLPSPPRIFDQNEAEHLSARKPIGEMPYLGGYVIDRKVIGNRTFLCGTRGLAILDGPTAPEMKILRIDPILVLSPAAAQREEAKRFRIPEKISLAQLKKLLANPNPYIVANALAASLSPVMSEGSKDYTSLIAGCVGHPALRVRSTAVCLLGMSKDSAVIRPLKVALSDSKPQIRAMAALALAKRGEEPNLGCFEEIFRHGRGGFGNQPFGADSSLGVVVDYEAAYEALAPHATPQAFRLLLEYPPPLEGYDNRTTVFPPLGESLRRHPEAAEILLSTAADDMMKVSFVRDVFHFAGKPMLPILHQALSSDDRVVRFNAARGCGAIGDPSSIPFLLKALYMESGLARAGIVWALGKLKAKEALPVLARLYVDARNDESRRAGAGFRISQSAAAIRNQYNALSSLDAVAGDWDELKVSLKPRPTNPADDEPLLKPQDILDAVGEIGPAAAQDFYRTLAGDVDAEVRGEAARNLAAGNPQDLDKNLPLLKCLLTDADTSVSIPAAVSLLILDREVARQPILAWLESAEPWQKSHLIHELGRVTNREQLTFAHKAIAAYAEDPTLDEDLRKAARKLLDSNSATPEETP